MPGLGGGLENTLGGHNAFAHNMQNAMGSMWEVNKANQNASLAKTLYGGGGGGQGPASNPHWNGSFGIDLTTLDGPGQYMRAMDTLGKGRAAQDDREMDMQQRRNDLNYTDWIRRISQPQFTGLLSQVFGGMGGSGMPMTYNTNFGASGGTH